MDNAADLKISNPSKFASCTKIFDQQVKLHHNQSFLMFDSLSNDGKVSSKTVGGLLRVA